MTFDFYSFLPSKRRDINERENLGIGRAALDHLVATGAFYMFLLDCPPRAQVLARFKAALAVTNAIYGNLPGPPFLYLREDMTVISGWDTGARLVLLLFRPQTSHCMRAINPQRPSGGSPACCRPWPQSAQIGRSPPSTASAASSSTFAAGWECLQPRVWSYDPLAFPP